MYFAPFLNNISTHPGGINAQAGWTPGPASPMVPQTWQPMVNQTAWNPWTPPAVNQPVAQPPWQWVPPPVVAPDPCTSQTATSWELFHHMGPAAGGQRQSSLLKRKAPPDLEEDRIHANKQLITEEKIAARLDRLHITAEEMLPPLPADVEEQLSSEEEEEGEVEVVLSSELKAAMRKQQEQLLPESILKEIEKPTMAVVLWQPPGRFLTTYKSQQELNNNTSATTSDENSISPDGDTLIPSSSHQSTLGTSCIIDEEMEDL